MLSPAHSLQTSGVRRRGPVRIVSRVLALSLLAAVMVVLPAPRVEAVETAVVDTRSPALLPLDDVATAGLGPVAKAATTKLPSGEDVAADLTDPTRRMAREEVGRFDMLGVTVDAVPDDHLLVRARVAGDWGRWMELDINPDHQPDADSAGDSAEAAEAAAAAPGVHSDPVWFGGADAYEISVPASVASIDVHLVRPEEQERVVVEEAPAGAAVESKAGVGAAAASAPALLSRSQWGAREPSATPSIGADLKLAVVHHSVNSNSYSAAQVPGMLRSIQTYHMDVQGWNDIAYNFAVDRFGRTWEARAGGVTQTVIGGHAKGFNTYTTGVMVLGDLTSTTPSQASVDSVADVIGWKFALDRQDPRGSTQYQSLGGPRYAEGAVVQLPRILGHRDVGQTGCPGSRLYARLGEIRNKAAARFDAYLAEQDEQPLYGDFDGDGLRDIMRYRAGGTVDLFWRRPAAGIVRSQLTISGVFRPAVGDFDGNGIDDIFWYGPGSHYDRVWYGVGGGQFDSRVIDIPEQGFPHVAELDGDGVDDVVLYAPGGAPDRIYRGLIDRTMAALPLAVDGNHEVLVGDYDADGRDDIFWYGKGSRDDSRAFSDGNGRFTYVDTVISGWFAPAVGDFDGNGHDDVFWYAPGTAEDGIWWGEPGRRGTVRQTSTSVKGEGYRPLVGDLNGDGREDLLWYKPGPSADPLWTWPEGRTKADRILSVGGVFQPDVGRYDGNAVEDIAWISPSGTSYLWAATGGGQFHSLTLG